MKNKKGFTLIELLAVVLILGILLLIAIPAVSKYLNKGTKTYYVSLEEDIVLAGRDYLNDYRALLPKEIGNVTVIDLNELVSNDYIEEVVDNNGKTCEAKMTVKKTAKNEYEYYSCVICEGYQSEGENCEYNEDNNITPETKNYSVEIDKDNYVVNQGETFSLPLAKAYYLGQLVSSNVVGSPKVIDTNKLGTTTVTYAYKGAKKSITVTVVDNVKPSTPQVVLRNDNAGGNSYNGNWYSGNVYVELKSTDYTKNNLVGSGISYYEISKDKNTWEKLNGSSTTLSESGNTTYYVRSVDKSGNLSEANTFGVRIDKADFECIIEISGTKGNNNWYTSNVQLQIKAIKEPVSGITAKGLNKTSVTANTAGDIITGTMTSGSGKIATCSATVKVDKATPDKPTITASDNITSGNWHNANVTLTTSGSSSTSGITYYLDTNLNPVTSRSSVTVSSNTTSTGTTYYAKACNGAGTCSQVNNYLLKIDKSTPSCTIAISGTKGNNDWYTSDVTLSLNITETPSLITMQNISVDKITSNTEGQTVTGTITSGVGTVATCSTTVKVDKSTPDAPTITASDNIASGNWHNDNVTLTTSGSSSISGITYYLDTNLNPTTSRNSVTVSTNTELTTYNAKACNGAGTCSSTSSYVLKLDKSTPTVSVTASDNKASDTWHTNSFTLNLSDANNISGYTYYIDTNTDPAIQQSSITVSTDTASTIYYYKVCSGAGLCSTVGSYIAKLDTITPTITAKQSSNYITPTTGKALTDYFNIGYGVSGGTTVCKVGNNVVINTNNLSLGVNTVSCTLTNGIGDSVSASTVFKHQYAASGTPVYSTKTYTPSYSCPAGGSLSGTSCIKDASCTIYKSCNVGTGYSCASTISNNQCMGVANSLGTVNCDSLSGYPNQWCDSSTYKRSSVCGRQAASGSNCTSANGVANLACGQDWTLSGTSCISGASATCNSGDTLSGHSCINKYQTGTNYSCPSGGTLSGTTCTFN